MADCRFANSKGVEVYRSEPGTRVAWNNNVFYGIWLCADSADKPHGFEISSIRITGR